MRLIARTGWTRELAAAFASGKDHSVNREAFSILAWISYFNLCFILDFSTEMVVANQRPPIQYHSHLVRTIQWGVRHQKFLNSASCAFDQSYCDNLIRCCTIYTVRYTTYVYSVSLVYCTYAWTNRGPIRRKINRRIDVWTNHGPIGEIHRWYICLQLCIIHDLHALERGSRAGEKKPNIEKASRFRRSLSCSPVVC